jgi:hypothetical protein
LGDSVGRGVAPPVPLTAKQVQYVLAGLSSGTSASRTKKKKPAFHCRHREVLNAVHSTCQRHHLSSEINPKDLPRVENTRGGPDIMLWHGRNWYTGDVVIGRNVNAGYTRKMRLYNKFAVLTKSETLPIAMDTQGRIHKSTWNTFLHLATGRPGFMSNLNELMQHALIRGQFHGLRRLVIRGELQQQPNDQDDFPIPSLHNSDAEDSDSNAH